MSKNRNDLDVVADDDDDDDEEEEEEDDAGFEPIAPFSVSLGGIVRVWFAIFEFVASRILTDLDLPVSAKDGTLTILAV